MALFSECSLECASKLLDTADIVREAILHQSSRVGRTTAATSRSLAALPNSSGAAAVTNEKLVYSRFAVLARVFAPAASSRFLDALTA
jgi:hypothetical protein